MAWAKLDDQFFYNKKIAQVDGPAKLLYIAGLVYVANQLSDGFIPAKAVKFIASTADVANCQDFARQLVDVCLWDIVEGGYIIHDYLAWNPSKEQVLHNREVRAEAGARGGQAKAANSKQNPSKLLSKSLAKVYPVPVPVPVKDVIDRGGGSIDAKQAIKATSTTFEAFLQARGGAVNAMDSEQLGELEALYGSETTIQAISYCNSHRNQPFLAIGYIAKTLAGWQRDGQPTNGNTPPTEEFNSRPVSLNAMEVLQ